MQIVYPFVSALLGYIFLHLTSNPKSKIHNKLPEIKFKWIQIFPSQKIIIRGRIIHLHHWLQFSLLLCVSVFANTGVLDSWTTRGFLLGGIIQGLRFPDRSIFKKVS